MKEVKPVFIKLLIAALAVFIIGVSVALSELYHKVGAIEHEMSHISSGGHHQQH